MLEKHGGHMKFHFNTIRILQLLIVSFLSVLSFEKADAQCQPAPLTNPAPDRLTRLQHSNCANVSRIQVSERPDFSHPSGVKVKITNVAADKSYVDLSVSYANGIPGGRAIPYQVNPRTKTLKVLGVIYTFQDEDGRILPPGAYETPTWMRRLIFGDGVIGYDGYYKNNSFRDHMHQSTLGRIQLTGEIYPTVVVIPLAKFRQFLSGQIASIGDEVYAAIERENPGYFTRNQYDVTFAYSSYQYAINRFGYSLGMGGGPGMGSSMGMNIPLDLAISQLNQVQEEVRTSFDELNVVTRFNVRSVEGVWLESDVNRTGTNYFTGGSILNYRNSSTYFSIKLGTALPSPQTRVRVRYSVSLGATAASTQKDTLDGGHGFGPSWMFHEMYHHISIHFGFSSKLNIGDYYRNNSAGYDLMTQDDRQMKHPLSGQFFRDGSILSAPNKYSLGLVTPFTLQYGENETSIRLYKTEFGDLSEVLNNITMIKVPLRRIAEPSGALRVGEIKTGEEFLLLEWRDSSSLSNGAYNFDRMNYADGLVAYHMVQTDAYRPTTHGVDIIDTIDSTPPFEGGLSQTLASPLVFGPATGVYEFQVDELWNELAAGKLADQTPYLLSEGVGTKTLYVRYQAANGVILGNSALTLDLSTSLVAEQRLPILSASMVNGYVAGAKAVTANYRGVNGFSSIVFSIDGKKITDRLSFLNQSTETFYFNTNNFAPGTHTLNIELYDRAFVRSTYRINFEGTAAPALDTLAPMVGFMSPSQSSTVSGLVAVNPTATDNVSVTRVDFYADGILLASDTSAPFAFSWDSTRYSDGAHSLKLIAYDAAGNASAPAQIAVNVLNQPVIVEPAPQIVTTPISSPNQSTISSPAPAPAEDTVAPLVAITSPASGSVVILDSTIQIQVQASDNVAVARVDIFVNGSLICQDTAAPYACAHKVLKSRYKQMRIDARAYDAKGNNNMATIFVTPKR